MEALAHQASLAILNMRLVDELAEAREMEIMGKVSSFVLHDLKNLVYTLSLILENAKNYIKEPEFQRDLLTSLGNTVSKMNMLISQLSGLPMRESLHREDTDLLDLAKESAKALHSDTFQVKGDPVPGSGRPQGDTTRCWSTCCATPRKPARVTIPSPWRLGTRGNLFVKVSDKGCGMEQEFSSASTCLFLLKQRRTTEWASGSTRASRSWRPMEAGSRWRAPRAAVPPSLCCCPTTSLPIHRMYPMPSLLVVDDNADIRKHLKWDLSKEPYDIHFAKDAEEAMEVFNRVTPGVVTLDLGLPPKTEDASQGSCLPGKNDRRQALRPRSSSSLASTSAAMPGWPWKKEHSISFASLSIWANSRSCIRRAFHLLKIETETGAPSHDRLDVTKPGHGIIGECPAMREVFAVIDKVASSDAPVLICGESGTGKELVAKALHLGSSRRNEPLVSINCGAIPENLLESEFFGHERGAFTGATNTVKGKVEYADKGTLFLDEIGELPVSLQVKLLRFLQEMSIQRVGGRKTIEVNVRVLAATNVNIKEAMRQGQFREDLYYRIGVVTIMLPPLRERGDDVLLLARHFLEQHGQALDSKVKGFTPEALASIKSYPWPGNVRELDNKIRRAMILAGKSYITPDDLGFTGETASPEAERSSKTLRDARSQLERRMVMQALQSFEGNIARASKSLGVSRPTLYDLMRKHGIDPNAGAAG